LNHSENLFSESLRIPEKDKAARNPMIYFLWQTGRFTNQKISELFGLSYPSISRRVGIFREKLRVDKTFKKKYDKINASIKMTPLPFNLLRGGQHGLPQERLRGSVYGGKKCEGGDRNATG
jgi:hypothetical protein